MNFCSVVSFEIVLK